MKKQNEAISSSLEDYLEAIAEIIERNGHAHAADIAEHLQVTTSSAVSALGALAARGLVNHATSPVKLTSSGAEKAAVIRRRHAALKRFFTDLLLLPAEAANAAACKVEHTIDETVMARMVTLAEAVSGREDCSMLRSYLNEVMPKIEVESDAELISLDKLRRDSSGVVVKVAENLRGIRKFADLGVVPGTLIQMEGRAPFGDLLRIKVMGSSLSLRSSDAMHIWVKVTE